MATEWFYTNAGQQCGPVSASELKSMAESGSLMPDDQVWKDGMAEWRRAKSLKGLFPEVSVATQTVSPPPLPKPTPPPLAQHTTPPSQTSAPPRDGGNHQSTISEPSVRPDKPAGFLDRVRKSLPSARYQVMRKLRRVDLTNDEIFAAIRERLPDCQMSVASDGTLEAFKIDQHLNLGMVDSVISMNWLLRDVKTHFSIQRSDNAVKITADVRQGWTKYFAVLCIAAVPLLLVGLAALGWAVLFSVLAKSKLRFAIEKLLNNVAFDLGDT